MNRINPNKLLLSKWTAVTPKNRERHFLVKKLLRDDDERIIGCELEAVINHNVYRIDWHELQDAGRWLTGWR
jgi:tryptophan-rich hypothetical protein